MPGIWNRLYTRARKFATAILLVVSIGGLGSLGRDNAAVSEATRAAAQALEAKLQTLQAVDSNPSSSHPPVVITESEANAYLQVHAKEFLPPGVHDPGVRFQPEHVTGFANVNFEQFSRTYANPNDWGPKILAAMFKGTQQATATGKIQSENGQATVVVESVTVGTTKMPSWLVDFVLQNYLEPRYKFDLSKPIPLPDHISQIVLGTGQAIFLRNAMKGH